MKKKCIILAALCVALSACTGQSVRESEPTVAVTPTAVHTEKPAAAPAPAVVTMEPQLAPTETPAVTLTPTPTSGPTPPKVSVPPSVEPKPPAVETHTPDVALPPAESAALPPEPAESLCGLPLAPTPTPEGSEPPIAIESYEPDNSPEPAVQPSHTSTPTPAPEPVRPTDEEVLAAYQAAYEAYTWFDWDSLPLDFSRTMTLGETEVMGWYHSSELSQPAPLGEGFYYPVADERFPTMDALRSYLKELFSDEVVDGLLPINAERYVEIDGVLCAKDDGPFRGTNENTGTVTKTVLWPEEGGGNLCTVHVEVELLWEDEDYPEGKRIYDFPYQKVGDKWVFTHFESIM